MNIMVATLTLNTALYGIIMGHLSQRLLQSMQTLPRQTQLGDTPRQRPSLLSGYPCEKTGALVFVLASLADKPIDNLPAGLLFGWFLLTLSWIDYHTLLLPDRLTWPCLLCGLASQAAAPEPLNALSNGLLGAISGAGALWLLQQSFHRIKGYHGLGDGDIKLLAALGAWLGWQALPWVCCGAALCGLAFSALTDRSREVIPFGPCLALSGWAIYISP